MDKELLKKYAYINSMMVRAMAMQTANVLSGCFGKTRYTEADFDSIAEKMQAYASEDKEIIDEPSRTQDEFIKKNINHPVETGARKFTEQETAEEFIDRCGLVDDPPGCGLPEEHPDTVLSDERGVFLSIWVQGKHESHQLMGIYYKVIDAIKCANVNATVINFNGDKWEHNNHIKEVGDDK